MILTDLPYGTVKGLSKTKDNNSHIKHGMLNKTVWDVIIPTEKIMSIANRILRKNGKMLLFSQQPFTNELITNAISNLPFSYSMIWEKDHFANCLFAKKACVNYYEDILLFSKTHETEQNHPLRTYFKQIIEFIGLSLGQINKKLGHRRAEHSFYINSIQYSLCTENTYNDLIRNFHINNMVGFKEYDELKNIDSVFNSVFNLWEGNKTKSNIFKYKKDYDGYHPTQKPVLLLEDLIKTFSNENNLVVDLTMGSGSTMIACQNTNRNGVGIEMDKTFFGIAKKRVEDNKQKFFKIF